MIKSLLKYFLLLLTFSSCLEEISLNEKDFENVLVIQARVTDELKKHKVVLSRTYPLNSFENIFENNAVIYLSDETNNKIYFSEVTAGQYLSEIEFKAEKNKKYKLNITTKNGEVYESNYEALPEKSSIDKLYTQTTISDDGENLVEILVDSYSDNNSSAIYYSYEFEETYQIVVPYYSNKTIVFSETSPTDFEIVTKKINNQICYATNISNNTIQINTSNLDKNIISKFNIKSIKSNDYIIKSRYSILVKQYSQSQEAYNYLKVLNELRSSENVFSENQPGFLAGNIFSTKKSKKAIGYFEVSSVDSERIFFTFRELFEDLPFPKFPVNCKPFSPDEVPIDQLKSGELLFYNFNNDPQLGEGRILYVTKKCGDCTAFGVTEKPDFW